MNDMTDHIPEGETLALDAAEGLVVKPGDKVLLAVRDLGLVSQETMHDMQGRLAARFPGVEFTFVMAESIAVQREDEDA